MSISIIDLASHYDHQLFCRVYEELLIPLFPEPGELDSFQVLMEGLTANQHDRDLRAPQLHILVAFTYASSDGANASARKVPGDTGTNNATPGTTGNGSVGPLHNQAPATQAVGTRQNPISETQTAQMTRKAPTIIMGCMVFEHYLRSNTGLISYMATSPLCRRQGITKLLLNHCLQILHMCDCVFAETHPATIQDEIMNPKIRHDVLHRLGFGCIPFPYIQPPTELGEPAVDNLLLLVHNRKHVRVNVVLDFVQEFADSVFGFELENQQYIANQWWMLKQVSWVQAFQAQPHPDEAHHGGAVLHVQNQLPWNRIGVE